jgi:hypothetical protein
MNQKMKYLVSCFVSLSAIAAFGQIKIELKEPIGDDFLETPLLSSVSFVPLQVERPTLIAQDMELKYADNQYFVLDHKNFQCIYRFDEEGNLLNTIGGEQNKQTTDNQPMLVNPVKFSINPYLKQAEIYSFEDSEIRRFQFGGKMIDRISMKMNPSDFIRDRSGNYWIYMGWNNSETAFRLLKSDGSGKVIERQMRLITKCTPNEGFSFYDSGNGICLWELLGNETFLITDNQIKKTFLFDFGTYSLPLNYHLMPAQDGMALMNNTGFYTVKKYLENNDFAYFFLNFTKPYQREMIHVIFDKKNKKPYVYNEFSGIGAFDKAQAITPENELLFLVSPRKFAQLFSREGNIVPDLYYDFSQELSSIRVPMVLKLKLTALEE